LFVTFDPEMRLCQVYTTTFAEYQCPCRRQGRPCSP